MNKKIHRKTHSKNVANCIFLKKRLLPKCFPVNFEKYFGITFLIYLQMTASTIIYKKYWKNCANSEKAVTTSKILMGYTITSCIVTRIKPWLGNIRAFECVPQIMLWSRFNPITRHWQRTRQKRLRQGAPIAMPLAIIQQQFWRH